MPIAAGAVGCVHPDEDYQAFIARPVKVREAGVTDVTLTPCEELLRQDLDGLFYTSCRPHDLPAPFALAVNQKVTPSADGKTATFDLSFTPLKIAATMMSETVGDLVTLPQTMLDTACAYTENIGTLTLGRAANALDRELTATNVVLRGKLQSRDRSCGELDGSVDLIMLSLAKDGDICVFVRAPDDGSLPVVRDPDDYVCDPSDLQPR